MEKVYNTLGFQRYNECADDGTVDVSAVNVQENNQRCPLL
jgi:hypothetical protein